MPNSTAASNHLKLKPARPSSNSLELCAPRKKDRQIPPDKLSDYWRNDTSNERSNSETNSKLKQQAGQPALHMQGVRKSWNNSNKPTRH